MTRPVWIQSRGYDLGFFLLSPLAGLLVLVAAPEGPSLIALLAGSLLGIPHYLSTFTFYLWDANRPYHRARWMAFFAGPLLIVAAVAALMVFHVPYVLQVVVYVWNTYHVALQSCGILSLYRHRAGAADRRLKPMTNTAVIASNFFLAFWNIEWYPTLHRFLLLISDRLPDLLRLGFGTVAAVGLLRLCVSLIERRRRGEGAGGAELGFLLTSLLLFHPYLWIRDANRATLGMLIGHFLQYLGLVWLLHRRRFREVKGSAPQAALARLSSRLSHLLPSLLVAGFGFFFLQLLADRGATTRNLYEVGFLTLALLHFYLDGLFWAFKDPQVKQSIAPLFAGRRDL